MLGLCNALSHLHDINKADREPYLKRGKTCIYTLPMTLNMLLFARVCKIVNFHEIIVTDYRGIILDLCFNRYMEIPTISFDETYLLRLDSRRKNHRKYFIDKAEALFDTMHIEALL